MTRFQVDPMKLCLGHHFSSLFVLVKLSDPAALKLNLKKWPQELNLLSFILKYNKYFVNLNNLGEYPSVGVTTALMPLSVR